MYFSAVLQSYFQYDCFSHTHNKRLFVRTNIRLMWRVCSALFAPCCGLDFDEKVSVLLLFFVCFPTKLLMDRRVFCFVSLLSQLLCNVCFHNERVESSCQHRFLFTFISAKPMTVFLGIYETVLLFYVITVQRVGGTFSHMYSPSFWFISLLPHVQSIFLSLNSLYLFFHMYSQSQYAVPSL